MHQKLRKYIKSNRNLNGFLQQLLKVVGKNKEAILYDELFSSVVGGVVRVTLKNIPGEFEIDAQSDILKSIMLTKKYEPEIVENILNHINKEKDAINIGANIGIFTNLMANSLNADCKVLAIEPTPNAYRLLGTNVKINKNNDKVIIYNGIATYKTGNFKINVINGNEEYSSLGPLVHPATKDKEYSCLEVKGETIDNLVETNELSPGLIVMDVEGAEFSVLKGSVITLRKFKPAIISEIDDRLLKEQNCDSRQIIEFLRGLGYQIINAKNEEIQFPFVGNFVAFSKSNL